jgi:hypothetical protein
MPVTMSANSGRSSIAGANPTVTVKLGGGMLPLNQKVLARLDQRNVAAHPWHDLEIGELLASVMTFSSLICKELASFVMEKTLSSFVFRRPVVLIGICKDDSKCIIVTICSTNISRIRISGFLVLHVLISLLECTSHRTGSTADFQLRKSSTRNLQIQSQLLLCLKV